MPYAQLLSDQPATQDMLRFERYRDPIVEAIRDVEAATPFTIGVFGAWGTGKSTLLGLVRSKLEEKREGLQFECIDFNPWLYRGEEVLLIPLVYALQSIIEEDPSASMKKALTEVAGSLARLGSSWLLRTATAGAVTLEQVEKYAEPFLRKREESSSAIQQLRGQLQNVVDEITNKGHDKRLVFIIDDLDRCTPDQIVDLLESIKLFLDLKHCVFLLALDREVIQQGIQLRYHEFELAEEREAAIGADYLEKMIQLPLYLYPLANDEIRDFVGSLKLPKDIQKDVDLLVDYLPANPRKIKRIVNLFLLHLRMVADSGARAAKINSAVLARIIALQVRDYSLFAQLAAYPELAEVLPKVFKGQLSPEINDGWGAPSPRTARLREICAVYSRRGEWVEQIFTSGEGLPKEPGLLPYLSLLGSVPET